MEFDQIPYPLVYEEKAAFKDTYGGAEGVVVCESYLLRPKVESDTVLVFMHPVGGGAYLPMVRHLARSGHHVIYCNSRYRSDVALIMEKVVLDLGACVRDAKERLGYAKVVLAGWSGGGALSLYYQEQAEKPWVTATPAGDPPDLTTAGLLPADAVMLLAAHTSRHGVLTLSLDPSIRDESDPDQRDPELDLYGPSAPTPPYDHAWLARFRDAQVERNRRITAWVKGELDRLGPGEERGFVVHGTMADPAILDVTIDANDRPAGMSYLGDPRLVNNGPVGLARFCTLRSWLSQWSHDDALGDGLRSRGGDLGAGARDRQWRRSRLLPQPRDGALRRRHARRQGAAHHRGRHALLHRAQSATEAAGGRRRVHRVASATRPRSNGIGHLSATYDGECPIPRVRRPRPTAIV